MLVVDTQVEPSVLDYRLQEFVQVNKCKRRTRKYTRWGSTAAVPSPGLGERREQQQLYLRGGTTAEMILFEARRVNGTVCVELCFGWGMGW